MNRVVSAIAEWPISLETLADSTYAECIVGNCAGVHSDFDSGNHPVSLGLSSRTFFFHGLVSRR